MTDRETDEITGTETTGHEWDGIKELNTPVPRAVYFFLIATALFSVGYWILMPAWPTGVTFTKGLLGIDQRKLAELAGLSVPTIQRMEASDGVIRGNVDSLMKLVSALNAAGIELIDPGATSADGGRGVRLRE